MSMEAAKSVGDEAGSVMTVQDYAHYTEQRYPVHWIDGLPWRIKSRILEPIAPPHAINQVSLAAINDVLKTSDAMLARWNEGWDTEACDWWWICCDDRDYDLDRLPRRGRRGARQGLARCEVRKIDDATLLDQGYAVYKAAHGRYPGHVPTAPLDVFANEIRIAASSGFYENWGCFTDGKLVAYARCILLDNTVNMSEVKSDPDHLAAKPNNALIFTLTRHYLRTEQVDYVTDGSRTVHHATKFQDFLEELGFRRIHCPLRMALAPLLDAAVRSRLIEIGRLPALGWIRPGLKSEVEAVTALWSIAQSCRKVPSAGAPSPGVSSPGTLDR